MINEKHLVLDYWNDVTLKMSKGICCSFFFNSSGGRCCLISYKIAPGHQAFVIVNIKDLICKIYALVKHVAHI